MAEVFLNDNGNGYTTTDAIPPMVEGESFTLYFHPDGGAELLAVRAFTSDDYPVAIPDPINNEIHLTWSNSWGNLYVDIYYSGSTPPTPPTPTYHKRHKMPIWMYPMFRR